MRYAEERQQSETLRGRDDLLPNFWVRPLQAHFTPGADRSVVLAIFTADTQDHPELFLIPGTTWLAPDAVFVSRDYEGGKSAPEWGINVSRKNLPRLREFAFARSVEALDGS